MKIVVDPQIYNSQVYGGISRYYTEVLSELDKSEDVDIEIPLLFSKNEYLKLSSFYSQQHKLYSFYINVLSALGVSTRKKVKKQNNIKTVATLKKQDYDVFIATYYDPYFLEYIGNKPFVLTVYDMIHELYPHYFNDADTIAANKLLLMKAAAKIIAVSHNTKKDILKIYPEIDPSKIEVVYHGSSIQINESKPVNLPDNYILFVGVREKYKNFELLVTAITDLIEADKTLHLVCAGGGKFSRKELEFLNKLDFKDRVTQKSFNEDELGMFYKNAKCFVFPSAYEGFGIPVLESMACGCPIVLPYNSSFPEVAGEAGIFYELDNAKDLEDKVQYVIYSENHREDYIAKGYRQVQKFTWNDAAQQCYAVYKQAVNSEK